MLLWLVVVTEKDPGWLIPKYFFEEGSVILCREIWGKYWLFDQIPFCAWYNYNSPSHFFFVAFWMLSCCWHCCHDMLWPALAVDMKMHPHLVLINWHSWAQSLSHCSHVIMMCPVGGDHKTTYGFCSEWSHMVTWIRCTDQISISVCVCVGVLSVYFCTALKTFHT